MEKQKYKDSSIEERLQLLEDNAYVRQDQDVKVIYTQAELDEYRQYLTQSLIDLDTIEDEKASVVADFSAKMKPLKNNVKEFLGKVKSGYEMVPTTLFGFDNQDESIMEFYNGDGDFVLSRRLLPNEKQTKLLNIQKQA